MIFSEAEYESPTRVLGEGEFVCSSVARISSLVGLVSLDGVMLYAEGLVLCLFELTFTFLEEWGGFQNLPWYSVPFSEMTFCSLMDDVNLL